ncbi:MAG: antitoxin [Spartobacteria bacterium]
MRTTVSLDDDVFEAAQTLAAASGKKLGKVLSQLARRGLRSEGKTSRRSGLPVFQVPADAPVIPSNRARRLLADDAT